MLPERTNRLALLSLLTSSFILVAATIRVPTDAPTIAGAIGASEAGDTVLVSCGTFDETDLWVPHDLLIRSETATPDCVVLDGQYAGSILTVHSRQRLTLEGLTFTRALLAVRQLSAGDLEGHLVTRDCRFLSNQSSIQAADSLSVERCEFVDNSGRALTSLGHGCIRSSVFSMNAGGGARLTGGSNVVADCTFEGNAASDGAAISAFGNLEVMGCTFASNVAGSSGGAIDHGFQYSSTKITDCLFNGNEADSGGAVMLGESGAVGITDCVFASNLGEQGAAVCAVYTTVHFDRCSFSDNCGGKGGAIHLDSSESLLLKCTLFRNWSRFRGGGLWLDRETAVTVDRTTFCSNGAEAAGGAIWVEFGPFVGFTLQHSIVAFSTAGAGVASDYSGTAAVVQCTDVFGNVGGDWTGMLAPHEHAESNFSADPLFCDPGAGDLTLSAESPCLPGNNVCGQVGAQGLGCGVISRVPSTWAQVKAAYRD